MHCEVLVHGLFAAGAGGGRLPSLELLLARGRRRSGEARSTEEWLRNAFELGDGPFPAGALTLAGCGGEPGSQSWARADPVHLRVMRDHAVVVPGEALDLPAEEAEALCAALAAHFPELGLIACDARRWCARLEAGFERGALDMAGDAVDPPKAIAAFVNEAQMVLHAHPVNAAREARGEPPLNSVWIWGAGAAPREPRSVWQSVAADDPAVRGAARLAGSRQRVLPRSASEWLERLPEDGRHLAVLDARRTPRDALERDWFAPLLSMLRAGRIGMVTLQVPDAAGFACETIRADLRRFWRFVRTIESYA